MIAEEGDLANIFVYDYCNNMNDLINNNSNWHAEVWWQGKAQQTQTKKHSQQNSTEHSQNQFIVLFPWKELLKKTITTFLEEDIQCDEVIYVSEN